MLTIRLSGPAALAGLLASAAAVPAAPLDFFLYADQGTDEVLLTRDANGDGDANDAGETTVFFSAANGSGLVGPTTNVLTLTQAGNGAVFVGDGGTNTVYRLRDDNADNSAQGAGEASVWFLAANADGLALNTPNGLAEGADGAIYVVEADTRGTPSGDFVYRTQDLNGDGDANDAGEATVWLDLQALSPNASAFEISFDGDTAYIADTRGTEENVIYRARDLDGNGTIGTGEVTELIAGDNPFGIPVDFAMDARDGSVFLWEFLDFAGPQSVVRLDDLDGSGVIDADAEWAEIWNTTFLPDGFNTFAAFGMAAAPDGSLLLTSNDGDAAGDNLVRLLDLNGDGDYLDAGETFLWLARSAQGTYPDRPRAVAAYAPIPLPAGLPLLGAALILLLPFRALRRKAA